MAKKDSDKHDTVDNPVVEVLGIFPGVQKADEHN